MAPRRGNMGWRKPVPKYVPDAPPPTPTNSSPMTKRLSSADLNKEMPPLPDDWFEQLAEAIGLDKRHGFVFDCADDSRWSDEDTSPSESNEDERQTASDHTCGPYRLYGPRAQKANAGRMSSFAPSICRRRRSLPHNYRPPTPPLPREHPVRRRAAYSAQRSNQRSHELPSRVQRRAYPHRAHPHASSHDALSSRYPSSATIYLPDGPATAVNTEENLHARPWPHTRYATKSRHDYFIRSKSGTSSSTGRRCRRHCDSFDGIWGDVKSFGVRIRVKISHAFRPMRVAY
ncbi:uncharacterized protein LAESUDRAFT_1826 [Laetiporus sulphureus 93-53]|uniref:Uncharacterized protein n=1 Tax=Laetiporus sulphureus 93-53 TaxID=1314785 RepID=A0A165I243_9APHY|nr:uncharacterized protein LAESUDRAFT_1826 [Laetiporus sulphureus 93-53]KZT12492.1 hypothetical protein LAESUDRAFT_1826 [Laetiporus sulphureus 93-53]